MGKKDDLLLQRVGWLLSCRRKLLVVEESSWLWFTLKGMVIEEIGQLLKRVDVSEESCWIV